MNQGFSKPCRPIWLILVDSLMAIVSFCAFASMVVVLVGGSIDPAWWWLPAFVVLAGPLVYLAVMLSLAYWIIRWGVFWLVILGGVMLFAALDLGAFVQMRFWNDYDRDDRAAIKVMNYNVHNFSYGDAGFAANLQGVMDKINVEQPDVICFEEFSSIAGDTTGIILNMFSAWPNFAAMYWHSTPTDASGTVIFSKYPMTVCDRIFTPNTTGGAIGVDLLIEGDTLRLSSCHLQTTAFNAVNDEREGLRGLFGSEDATQRALTTTRVMRDSFILRAAQTDSLALAFAASPHPLLVVGDMNSVPLSYTYNGVKGDLSDAFRAAGQGYGSTFRPMKGMFRIDYVFYDGDKYDCVDYQSPDLSYSDHKPVIVTLKKNI